MKQLLRILILSVALTSSALATCVLRQSDATEITLGPYVDQTDGFTPETGLTVSQGDVILKKCAAGGDCGASAQKNDTGACAHDANGMYECDLNATDTDTVGILEIWSFESGALPVFKTCLIEEEAVFDRDHAASATGIIGTAQTGDSFARLGAPAGASHAADNAAIKADTAAILDDTGTTGVLLANSTTNCRDFNGCAAQGTLSGTHSATTADLGTNAPSSAEVVGMTLNFPGHDLSRVITSYNTGTGVATFASTSVTLANSDQWYLHATAPTSGGGGSGPTAVEIRQEIDNNSTQLAAILEDTGTTLQGEIDGVQADTEDLQTRVPAALVSGRMDSSTGAMANNVLTDAAIAADAEARMQTEATDALNAYDPPTTAEMVARTLATADYATATALADVPTVAELNARTLPSADYATAATQATIAAYIDTEIATLLTGVNIEQINGNDVCGTGDAGTPWTGCP